MYWYETFWQSSRFFFGVNLGRAKFLSICTNYLIAFGKSAFKGEYGMAIILRRMQQAIY